MYRRVDRIARLRPPRRLGREIPGRIPVCMRRALHLDLGHYTATCNALATAAQAP
jgi:hypothetical protein